MFYLPNFNIFDAFTLARPDGEIHKLEELKRRIVLNAHEYYQGDIKNMLQNLKIGRSTLYRMREVVSEENRKYAEQRVERLLDISDEKPVRWRPTNTILTQEFNLFQLDSNGISHIKPLEQCVDEIIDIANEHYSNRTEAARRLGIGRSTLYRKLDLVSG